MDRYCYKVKITCTFERMIYANNDKEAIENAEKFRIQHNNGYQNADDKETKIIQKF